MKDLRSDLTRDDVERLCILDALTAEGCTVAELTRRLGLAETLRDAAADAMVPLVQQGLVEERDGLFLPSSRGLAWLERETSALQQESVPEGTFS